MDIRECAVDEIFDSTDFTVLSDLYRAECQRNNDLPSDAPDRETYMALDRAGLLIVIGAYVGATLHGFAAAIKSPALHHGSAPTAMIDTIYMRPATAGLSCSGYRLIAQVEITARERWGVPGVYISAPVGGRLERILPRLGYTATNTIFYRSFFSVDGG